MRLQDKTIIITGAASGIGAACARTYAREGASVFAADFNPKGVAAIAQEIAEAGGKVFSYVADLGERAAIDGLLAEALRVMGHIDVLHNNTAFAPRGALGDVSFEDWQRAFDIGLTSYWYATRQVLPHMLERQHGVILNTASISALAADHGLGGYNVMKAGVLNLTRSIAIDYARKGIRCNAISPGIIHTEPFDTVREKAPTHFDHMANAVPMGRFGTPQEIANVALFLASDEASYVTGANIVADGGRTAHTGQPSPIGFQPY